MDVRTSRNMSVIVFPTDPPIGPQLALATKKGTPIPNERGPKLSPVQLEAARDMLLNNHSDWVPRALDSTYNCLGLVFAARRTWIEPEQFALIREDDGYRALEDDEIKMPGDVVVYSRGAEVAHVAQLIQVLPRENGSGLWVLSQFGQSGEYLHDAVDLPEWLCLPRYPKITVWTDRT